jgi:hypothetical protein
MYQAYLHSLKPLAQNVLGFEDPELATTRFAYSREPFEWISRPWLVPENWLRAHRLLFGQLTSSWLDLDGFTQQYTGEH